MYLPLHRRTRGPVVWTYISLYIYICGQGFGSAMFGTLGLQIVASLETALYEGAINVLINYIPGDSWINIHFFEVGPTSSDLWTPYYRFILSLPTCTRNNKGIRVHTVRGPASGHRSITILQNNGLGQNTVQGQNVSSQRPTQVTRGWVGKGRGYTKTPSK